MSRPRSVVMIGASGAVGGAAVKAMLAMPEVQRLTLLNRRLLELPTSAILTQHVVDPLAPASYAHLLAGHTTAICTLGVGQPSKVTQVELERIDKVAALDFGQACRAAGVEHFELLAAVAADARSRNHYLRTKGELIDGLAALGFARLSVFRPSMIVTPENRYDWTQAVLLKVWPLLSPLLVGGLQKFRGIPVGTLGAAMAENIRREGAGRESLHWREMVAIANRQ